MNTQIQAMATGFQAGGAGGPQIPQHLLQAIINQLVGPQSQVEFYQKAVPDKKASKAAGRPIDKDMDYVRIITPADPKFELRQPAHTPTKFVKELGRHVTYAELYPQEYEAYKRGQQMVLNGTNLDHLNFLTEAQKSNLRAAGIFTAENLAAIDGAALASLGMGARAMKEGAVAYIQAAAGTAEATAMASQMAELQRRMEYLMSENEKLVDTIREIKDGEESNPLLKEAAQPHVEHAPVENGGQGGDAVRDPDAEGFEENFDGWSVDDLKVFIEEQTNTPVVGKPNKRTLVQMAREAHIREWGSDPEMGGNGSG